MPTGFNFSARHLSASEVITDVFQECGGSIYVHVALIHSEVHIPDNVLLEALITLCRYQPALRMRIHTESGRKKDERTISKRFVEMDNLNIHVDRLKVENRKSWVRYAEEELKKPFESDKGPLWKVSFIEFEDEDHLPVPDPDAEDDQPEVDQPQTTEVVKEKSSCAGAILFKIHHVIADGVSMFDVLHGQLLPILNTLLAGGDLKRYDTPLPMIPSADDSFAEKTKRRTSLRRRFSWRNDKRDRASKSHSGSSKNAFTPLLNIPPSNGTLRPEKSSTRILPFGFSPVFTSQIIEACKSQDVKVHSMLMAACTAALISQAAAEKVDIGEEVVCGFPVDLRQYRTLSSPQPLGQWLGYGVAKIKTPHKTLNQTRFWREVRHMSENTSAESKPWKVFSSYSNSLKTISKEGAEGHPVLDLFGVHFELANLGNCDVRTASSVYKLTDVHIDPKVRLEEHYFTKSMSDVTQYPLLLAVSTYRGRLMWTLSYNAKWVTRHFATKYVDRLAELLKHMTMGEGRDRYQTSQIQNLPPVVRARETETADAETENAEPEETE